jgi:hypothetical protein
LEHVRYAKGAPMMAFWQDLMYVMPWKEIIYVIPFAYGTSFRVNFKGFIISSVKIMRIKLINYVRETKRKREKEARDLEWFNGQ